VVAHKVEQRVRDQGEGAQGVQRQPRERGALQLAPGQRRLQRGHRGGGGGGAVGAPRQRQGQEVEEQRLHAGQQLGQGVHRLVQRAHQRLGQAGGEGGLQQRRHVGLPVGAQRGAQRARALERLGALPLAAPARRQALADLGGDGAQEVVGRLHVARHPRARQRRRHLRQRRKPRAALPRVRQHRQQVLGGLLEVGPHEALGREGGEAREQRDHGAADELLLGVAEAEDGVAHLAVPRQHELARVAQQLPQRQQRPVHRLQRGDARQPALRLLEQAVVPLHAVPRLPLLHQHQARPQRGHRRLAHALLGVAQRVPDDLDEGAHVHVEHRGRGVGQLLEDHDAGQAGVLLAGGRQPVQPALHLLLHHVRHRGAARRHQAAQRAGGDLHGGGVGARAEGVHQQAHQVGQPAGGLAEGLGATQLVHGDHAREALLGVGAEAAGAGAAGEGGGRGRAGVRRGQAGARGQGTRAGCICAALGGAAGGGGAHLCTSALMREYSSAMNRLNRSPE
jgi:hypothetical protein